MFQARSKSFLRKDEGYSKTTTPTPNSVLPLSTIPFEPFIDWHHLSAHDFSPFLLFFFFFFFSLSLSSNSVPSTFNVGGSSSTKVRYFSIVSRCKKSSVAVVVTAFRKYPAVERSICSHQFRYLWQTRRATTTEHRGSVSIQMTLAVYVLNGRNRVTIALSREIQSLINSTITCERPLIVHPLPTSARVVVNRVINSNLFKRCAHNAQDASKSLAKKFLYKFRRFGMAARGWRWRRRRSS